MARHPECSTAAQSRKERASGGDRSGKSCAMVGPSTARYRGEATLTHDFDWSKAPQPWCWIGPEWRNRAARLAGTTPSSSPKAPQNPNKRIVGLKGLAAQEAKRGLSANEVQRRYTERLKAALDATR